MSFGASPSDIIIVVTFARRLYRQCRNAGGEYLEISREVRGLHTVLKHLKYEVEAAESVLNRDKQLYARELAPVIGDCDITLRQLDELLQKYGRLAGREGGAGRLWDKIRFGSNELDEVGSIRMKLINHKTSITVFLDTIQLHESGRMSQVLDNQNGQLDIILDKVDTIARRMGQRAGSVMTTYDDDDKEVWKQFRRELVQEGFSSDVLQQHKDVLRAYIREIDQNGLLDEVAADPLSASSAGVNPERWLESVPAPKQSSRSEQLPPAFETLRIHPEDTTAKEMVVHEEDFKFPQSIKTERARPETGPIEDDAGMQMVPHGNKLAEHKEGINVAASPLLKVVTEIPELKPPILAFPFSIMSTTDLVLRSEYKWDPPGGDKRPSSSQEDYETGYISASSPIELRVGVVTLDDRVPRSMAHKSRTTLAPEPSHYGTSPSSQYGTSPASQYGTSPGSSRSPYGSPRSSILAPDSQGNPIPLEAKWTKVNRSLISTEVLDQDKRRYEARPDFVAVLGVLSREEIEEYAVRSKAIRESRKARQRGFQPPQMPPRPVEQPERRRHVSFDDVAEASPSPESDEDRDRRPIQRERRSYPSPNPPLQPSPYYPPSPTRSPPQRNTPQFVPVSQYPVPSGSPYVPGGPPYATPATAPMWIPPPGSPPQAYWPPVVEVPREVPRDVTRTGSRARNGSSRVHKEKDRERERERERERDREWERERDRDRDRDRDKDLEIKKRRWRDFTAAGIGGAAVSLLSVLTEAAEHM